MFVNTLFYLNLSLPDYKMKIQMFILVGNWLELMRWYIYDDI